MVSWLRPEVWGAQMFCRVIARAIAVERVKALVKQWLSPSLYNSNLNSKSIFRRPGRTLACTPVHFKFVPNG